jgi:hypothetical protein
MLGCLYGQEHYGTIQIDKDDVQIGMSENLWAHLLTKNGEREMACSLSGIALFVCLITRVAQNRVWIQKQRQKNQAPSH